MYCIMVVLSILFYLPSHISSPSPPCLPISQIYDFWFCCVAHLIRAIYVTAGLGLSIGTQWSHQWVHN